MVKRKKSSSKKTSAKASTKKTSPTTKKKVVIPEKASVSHFEVPFEDLDRAKEFYSSVFGWNFVDVPDIDYTMVYSVDVDEKQMPVKSGAINGGFVKRSEVQQSPTLVMTVKSIDKTLKILEKFGGSVAHGKEEVPNMGYFVLVKDSEQNVIGILEAKS